MAPKKRKFVDVPREWELSDDDAAEAPDAADAADAPRPPDDDGGDVALDWSEESDEENAMLKEGEEAGVEFVEFALEMVELGRMSAKAMCTLCWWASRAGAQGPICKYALNPTAQTGKFQDKIDRVNGFDSKNKAVIGCRQSVMDNR